MSQVRLQGMSDVGCVRSVNEDSYLIQPLQSPPTTLNSEASLQCGRNAGFLAAVADGMGGAAAGEVASHMALTTLRDHVIKNADTLDKASPRQIVAIIEEGILLANSTIFEASQTNPKQKGMGATITAVFVKEDVAYIFQVGDSRAYVHRSGKMSRLTRDQSFVSHLMEMGTLTEEQAAKHPQRNVILQALGTRSELVIDVSYLPLCQGDFLLLCSDGLYTEYPANELGITLDQFLAQKKPNGFILSQLIAGAKKAGGHDNISIICIHLGEEGLPERQPGEVPSYLPFPFLENDNPIREIFKMLQ